MFDNDLHIPLRFYDAVEKQDRFRPYNKNKRFNQYTDIYHLPHFQVKVLYETAYANIAIVDASTGIRTNIVPHTIGSDWMIVDYDVLQYSQFIYNGCINLVNDLIPGTFYIELVTSKFSNFSTYEIFYSEIFTVGDISDKFILQWSGTNDIGGIDYTITPPYNNSLIFDATLAKPEYVLEEEAVEDGDGSQMLTWQRSVKEFKMWFYAPEYIADALALVGLHDFVTLTTHYMMPNQETGLIYDFTMVSEWMESKGLSKITCTFRDAPIIKTNCANNLA